MTRPTRLECTRLEDRSVPAGFGNAWVDTNLTVSFVPDGTDVAGAPSALYRTLGDRLTAAEWQGVVRTVFQEWITPTNLNVAFVGDDGRALGSPGPVQGSPYVGDIRISARPLSENVMAITNPFDLVSPWAGEIILNSNKSFSTDRSAGTVDLRTVLLQEVGHALGVGNSTDPRSVMYEYGGNPNLGTNDVLAVQAIYGVREPDQFEGKKGNGTPATASTLLYASSKSVGSDAAADLTTASDVDFYRVSLPASATDPTVVVRTGGLSQVRLKITVYGDSKLKSVLGESSAPDANGNYSVRLTGATPGTTVYIRVEAAANAGPFGVGGYTVAVGDGTVVGPPPAAGPWINSPNGRVVELTDWSNGVPGNDTLGLATPLGRTRTGTDARWDFTGVLRFDAAQDVDYYQFVPADGGVIVISVDTPAGGVTPTVALLNADGQPLPTTVLLRTATSMIIQVEGVQANRSLVVRVGATNPSAWHGPQSYRLGIDLRQSPIKLDTIAQSTLTQTQTQLARTLEVTRSQAFRFQLSAATTATVPTAARFTVFDASGTAVFTMVAQSGETVVGDVLLAPGTYTIVIAGTAIDGTSFSSLSVDIRYMALTDPIGPALADDYTAATSTTDTAQKTSSSTSTSTSDTGYQWITPALLGSGFLAPSDLYSSPWW